MQITIESFAFRKFKTELREPKAQSHTHAVHLLVPNWQREILPRPRADRSLLIFSRGQQMFEAMRTSVDATVADRLWLAVDGEVFDVAHNVIEWNRDVPKHFELLYKFLTSQCGFPQTVVFDLTSYDGQDEPWINDAGLEGVWLASNVMRALYGKLPTMKIHACFIVSGQQQEKAMALLGLLRSIHREIPTMTATVVQIDRATSGDPHAYANRILDEALSSEPREPVLHVVHDYNGRSVQRFTFAAPIQPAAVPVEQPRQRVVVIAGGTGALGKLFATALGRWPGARIAILGASQLSESTDAFVRNLQASGTQAAFWQVDCSDLQATNHALSAVRAKFGPITDILHCVGVLNDEFFVRQSQSAWTAVVRTKVQSALNLDALTEHDPIERFVLCSSLAGTYGNVGQSAYALANGWLDGFSMNRDRKAARGQRKGRSISIAWPLWGLDRGMQAPVVVTDALERLGLSLLPGPEGVDVLLNVMVAPSPVIIPVRGERAAIASLLKATTDHSENRMRKMPSPPSNGLQPKVRTDQATQQSALEQKSAPSNDVEPAVLKYITGVLSKTTGTPESRIDPDASLEAFGLNSILVSQMNAAMEERFPNLSKTVLFEVRNLRALARLMIDDHATHAHALAPETKQIQVIRKSDAVNSSNEEIRSNTAEPTRASSSLTDGIAIVGLAGRYPGSATLTEFWDHLAAGQDLVIENPSRWPDMSADGDDKIYAKWGGFIDDVDKFDPLFFGISPRDAERMDPQERLFLQTAYHAIEDAGFTPESISGPRDGSAPRRRVGVFAGVMYGEYQFFGCRL